MTSTSDDENETSAPTEINHGDDVDAVNLKPIAEQVTESFNPLTGRSPREFNPPFHQMPRDIEEGKRLRKMLLVDPQSPSEAQRRGTLIHRMVELIAGGWMSTSNKYRHVSRLKAPSFKEAVKLSDDVPEWLREQMRRDYAKWLRWGARVHGERLTLTEEEWKLFKEFGGETA